MSRDPKYRNPYWSDTENAENNNNSSSNDNNMKKGRLTTVQKNWRASYMNELFTLLAFSVLIRDHKTLIRFAGKKLTSHFFCFF